jgi:D-alanyl-D-alanine carboxypeptidase (penicillin-binding protein 5/6)
VTAVYEGQVRAPVVPGTPVGKLVVTAPEMDPYEIPLVAAERVERLGPVGRMATAAGYLLWGKKN